MKQLISGLRVGEQTPTFNCLKNSSEYFRIDEPYWTVIREYPKVDRASAKGFDDITSIKSSNPVVPTVIKMDLPMLEINCDSSMDQIVESFGFRLSYGCT